MHFSGDDHVVRDGFLESGQHSTYWSLPRSSDYFDAISHDVDSVVVLGNADMTWVAPPYDFECRLDIVHAQLLPDKKVTRRKPSARSRYCGTHLCYVFLFAAHSFYRNEIGNWRTFGTLVDRIQDRWMPQGEPLHKSSTTYRSARKTP